MTSARRATLRLAWRLVRRSPVRSLLVAALVAVPVLAGTFALVTIRTSQLSPEEAAARNLGRADAIAVVTTASSLDPSTAAVGRSSSGATRYVYGGADKSPSPSQHRTGWVAELPAGARVVADGWQRSVKVTFGNLAATVEAVALDLGDPVTRGIYSVREGRVPAQPAEVAVTEALAERLDLNVGDRLALAQLPSVSITAIVRDPRMLSAEAVVGAPSTFGGLGTFTQPAAGIGQWLIDTPDTAPDLHDRLAASGVVYATRSQWEHPPSDFVVTSHVVDTQVLVVLATVAGFGLLVVVLLAGAAFAVAARRQSRDLGLLAASGGDVADVRRVVLAQGALLGLAGGVLGAALGTFGVALFRSALEEAAGRTFGALDPHVVDVVGVLLVGVVAGLVAAVMPARGAARRPTLDMLANRFDADDASTRNPRWATIALVVGPLVTIAGAVLWHGTDGSITRSYVVVSSVGDVPSALGRALWDDGWAGLIWVGSVLTLAGLVRSCPLILSRLGRLAARLPLTGRLALRDAARHRHRTAPATAAVLTVLAGAVVVLFVASSADLHDRQGYQPMVPVGTMSLQFVSGSTSSAEYAAALGTVARATGGGLAAPVSIAASSAGPGGRSVGVVEPSGLDLLTGGPRPQARQVFAAGGALLLDRGPARSGTIKVHTVRHGHRTAAQLRTWTPGQDVGVYGGVPDLLVSPQTAAAQGWRTRPLMTVFDPRTLPTEHELDLVRAQLGPGGSLYVEHGYESRFSVVLLVMLVAAGLATLAGASIVVALAMAESRADMATLAAVGASPGRRRLHAMGQAATVAGVGTVIGFGLGLLVAIATLGGSTFYPTSVPFAWLALVLLAPPLLAVTVAGLFTRSKVTMTRRLT